MNQQRDLRHFLSLAAAQIRNRMQKAATPAEKARLKLLEDLIKEQVPQDENTGHSVSAPR